jgi:hypothetical protein
MNVALLPERYFEIDTNSMEEELVSAVAGSRYATLFHDGPNKYTLELNRPFRYYSLPVAKITIHDGITLPQRYSIRIRPSRFGVVSVFLSHIVFGFFVLRLLAHGLGLSLGPELLISREAPVLLNEVALHCIPPLVIYIIFYLSNVYWYTDIRSFLVDVLKPQV